MTTDPVSALAVSSTGRLVVADRSGRLVAMDAPAAAPPHDGRPTVAAARDRVEEFLAATTELPDDADPDTGLIRTDGQRTWDPTDLETVTTSDDADPTWLRLQAAINAHRHAPE